MPYPGRVIENQILHAHAKVGHVNKLEQRNVQGFFLLELYNV